MNPTQLRILWMTEYGLDSSDLHQSITNDPPTNLKEEQENLDAVRQLKSMDMSWLKEKTK